MVRWAELVLQPRISCRSTAKKYSARHGVGQEVARGSNNRGRGVNGIACCAYGTITEVEVLALLGRASSFMAEVGYIRRQASETPSV